MSHHPTIKEVLLHLSKRKKYVSKHRPAPYHWSQGLTLSVSMTTTFHTLERARETLLRLPNATAGGHDLVRWRQDTDTSPFAHSDLSLRSPLQDPSLTQSIESVVGFMLCRSSSMTLEQSPQAEFQRSRLLVHFVLIRLF